MQTQTLLDTVLTELDNLKAINIVPIQVTPLCAITDYMVIATGNSPRHVRAIAQHLVEKMKVQHVMPFGVEGDVNNEWVLVDLGAVVVHIMQQRARDFYQLEKLWAPNKTPLVESLL